MLFADDLVCIFVLFVVFASCTGCYWWLGDDAGSHIQVVSFV